MAGCDGGRVAHGFGLPHHGTPRPPLQQAWPRAFPPRRRGYGASPRSPSPWGTSDGSLAVRAWGSPPLTSMPAPRRPAAAATGQAAMDARQCRPTPPSGRRANPPLAATPPTGRPRRLPLPPHRSPAAVPTHRAPARTPPRGAERRRQRLWLLRRLRHWASLPTRGAEADGGGDGGAHAPRRPYRAPRAASGVPLPLVALPR